MKRIVRITSICHCFFFPSSRQTLTLVYSYQLIVSTEGNRRDEERGTDADATAIHAEFWVYPQNFGVLSRGGSHLTHA